MADDLTKKMSRRQFSALLWAVMVSPIIRQIPATVAPVAGRGAWLSALFAAVPAAALGLFAGHFLRSRRPGEGFGELFCRALGPAAGRIVTALYLLWLVFFGGFVLRAGADRFVSAIYTGSPEWLFMAVMGLLCLVAGEGRLKTLGRFAQIIAPLLSAVFALVFLFCLKNVKPDNLWPLYAGDLPRAFRGVLPLMGTLAVGVYPGFLAAEVEPGRLGRTFSLSQLSLALLGALLCFTSLGTFGAELTDKMNYPFFVMIRSIRIFNLLERVEALVAAQWVAADFLLLGTLLQITGGAFALVLHGPGGKKTRLGVRLCAAGMGLAAWQCAPSAFALRTLSRGVILWGNALLVFGLLPVCYAVGRLRKTIN